MPAIEAKQPAQNLQGLPEARGAMGVGQGSGQREYKTVEAVRDVSFTIETGEMVAFLGPNGAGIDDDASCSPA